MVKNNVFYEFFASVDMPNPNVGYWIDLKADPNGQIVKFYNHNTRKWIKLTDASGGDATPPYIGSNKNWWVDGRDTGVSATGHSPYIGSNGNWFIWDENLKTYIDSGIASQVQYVLTKEKVEAVLTGDISSHTHDARYYTKTQTDGIISPITTDIEKLKEDFSNLTIFDVKIVSVLPAEGVVGTIYLVPNIPVDKVNLKIGNTITGSDGSTIYTDAVSYYDEYIWLPDDKRYESIGTTKADLSDYYNKLESDDIFVSKTEVGQNVPGIADIFLNEVLKKTPQALTETERNQVKANLGLSKVSQLVDGIMSKEDKIKLDGLNNYDDSALVAALADKRDKSDSYSKAEVDQRIDDVVSGDINLSNYYTKQETYSKSEIDRKGYITQETDPTVPAWAKEPNKPTYTAAEVGALPADTQIPDISGLASIAYVNSELSGKQDILISGVNIKTINGEDLLGSGNIEIKGSEGGIPDAPSDSKLYGRKNSNWEEVPTPDVDKSYVDSELAKKANVDHTHTIAQVTDLQTTLDDKAAKVHQHVKADITDFPTNISEFTNDSGYLTAIPDEYITESELTAKDYATKTELSTGLSGKVDKDGNKVLSDNNYTTPEKEKLASLSNYDDSTITQELQALKDSKGKPDGIATLDSNGFVPSSQLPAYVDDIIDLKDMVENKADIPTSGLIVGDYYYVKADKKIYKVLTESTVDGGVTPYKGKIYVDDVTHKTYRWSGTDLVEISASLALGETADTAYPGDKGKQNADNITALQTGKVDKESGKGLSTNDFTDDLKSKLEGIEAGAQVNKVTSVAGREGDVVLTKADVGLDAVDNVSVNSVKATIDAYTVNGKAISTNPTLVKADVGLSNVDNTSDADKPISTATQDALDLKADKTAIADMLTKTEAGTTYATKEEANEVIVNDGTEPSGQEEIWVDFNDNPDYTDQVVLEAPKDNKTYARKNGSWSVVNIPDVSNFITESTADSKYQVKGNYATTTQLDDKADKVTVVSGGSGTVSKQLNPNTYYEFGTCSKLTITLAAEISGIYNEYMFEFKSGSTATTLSIPSSVNWMGGEAPTIESNKTYQCSIVNNIAVIGGK